MRFRRVMGGWALIYDIRDSYGESIRVLRVRGVFQSATYHGQRRFELPFEYFRAFNRMFDARGGCEDAPDVDAAKLQIRRVLVIGGGGCAYPKHLVHEHPEITVDVVERDPKVVKIARNLFYADEMEKTGRAKIIVSDGVEFLENTGTVYDVIINDAFNGADAVEDLLEGRVMELTKSRLTNAGLYLMNVVCEQDEEGAEHLNSVLRALQPHFAYINAVQATDGEFGGSDNFIVIASDAKYEFKDAMQL